MLQQRTRKQFSGDYTKQQTGRRIVDGRPTRAAGRGGQEERGELGSRECRADGKQVGGTSGMRAGEKGVVDTNDPKTHVFRGAFGRRRYLSEGREFSLQFESILLFKKLLPIIRLF